MYYSIRTIGNLPWFFPSSTPDDKSTRPMYVENVGRHQSLRCCFFIERQASLILALDKDSLDFWASVELEIIFFHSFGNPELEIPKSMSRNSEKGVLFQNL